METYIVKLSGWETIGLSVEASGIDEARYYAAKAARELNARLLWVGKGKA